MLTERGVVIRLHVEQAPPRHDLIVRARQRAAETLFRDGVGGDQAEAGPVHEARDQQPRVVLRTDDKHTALVDTNLSRFDAIRCYVDTCGHAL